MLLRSRRLNLKKDFKWVAGGRKIYLPCFNLMWRDGKNPQALVGIALSSQNFKKASQRNRARRLVSKAIEDVYDKLRNDLNLVIMPKKEVLGTKVEKLSEELLNVKDLYSSD